ncbi:putative hydrolase [Komagataeibacter europaeus]|uniref:Hydrolase n=1 Tax=Komagataeibacter europaeus TaxID=33995 RepID=A0A0M0EFP0_KOMEU|nr:Zn-dependent hydrolase [Komagataeibacter europaeus]KON64082.1 putative hydrolase [Komagataeibacter europaeus]
MTAPTLRVNPTRLLERIVSLGACGALPGGGVSRLALTDADAQGRAELLRQMRELDMEIRIDPVGNIFGIHAGVEDAVVMMGSHIDTVSTGGLYDGALGVIAGLEVVACLKDAGIRPRHPVVVAAFTNEEGARYAPDMLGSLVYSGAMDVDDAYRITGCDGSVLGEELRRIGHCGMQSGPRDIHAYVELHIEQGPVLEDQGLNIGIVTGVQGISWTEVTVEGRSAHAGTTPARLRHDAGLAAAYITMGLSDMVAAMGPAQLATVGALTLTPNLVNVVASRAVMTVDLRNPDNTALCAAEATLAKLMGEAEARYGVNVSHRTLARFEPVPFTPALVDTIEATARQMGLSCMRLYSGAGHDAQMIAPVAPAAMIFVPSVAGISHNIREYTHPDDIMNGANLLLRVVTDQAGLA